jgi:hypothetical protein
LWDDSERRFLDRGPFFVPNKAATIVEALCLLARYEGNDEWIVRYVRPTADAIVALQVRRAGDALDGAIDQAQVRTRGVGRFFPFYVARCVPGLVEAAAMLGDQRYLDAAMSAIRFVLRWQDADGGFPQVLYADGRINRYPRWIAGVGDVVRAIELLRPHGLGADSERALGWLLLGQTSIGAFESAAGFGSQVTQRVPDAVRDARDYLPVVGWNDKTFRALAERAAAVPDRADLSPVENDCSWFGERATYRETEHEVEVRASGTTLYRWTKGTPWAEIGVRYRRRRRIRS